MRITFISPTVGMSGGIKVMVIYARHLMARGHTVRIISPPPTPIAMRRKFKSLLKGKGWPANEPQPQSYFDGSGVDHRIIERRRPIADDDVPDGDVVIATWWETAEWVNALSPSKGAKVYFIQGYEVFPHLPVARCRATYQLPLHKIVVARWLKEIMSVEYGDKVVDIVPNSVDRKQFFAPIRDKQPTPTVGFLYSTDALKGLDVSTAALQIVRKCIPNLRIISFGSQRPIRELELPEGTEFYFRPPQDQIKNLYARCDVWLTASRSEGFNLPAMEAMACRTPVISTRTGWPEEAIRSGWNGMLVDIDDQSELARAVEWVLSRSGRDWKEMSSNAYATATSGSWEKSTDLFEQALHHARSRTAQGEIART